MRIHVIQGKRAAGGGGSSRTASAISAMSGIRGFEHRHQAERAAMDAFGGEPSTIDTTDGEQYAGERDFG